MPKALDPFWEYGEPDTPGNRQNLHCKICGKGMTGGITRLKYHIAKIPGHEVEICKFSTEELVAKAIHSLEGIANKKEFSAAVRREIASKSGSDHTVGQGLGSVGAGSSHSPMPSATSPFFVPRTTPGAQPSITSMLKKDEQKQARKLVGRCLLWSDIPFSFARNPFYVSMFEAVSIVGPGFKPPTYEELRGPILQDEKDDCTERLQELRKSWEITGCTIMSDGWTDGKGRTLLNFLVHCPRGIMFLKSVDASAQIKDATLLCDLLDEFIQEIGAQHVVQIITDNAANYVAAGRMLMSRYPTIFWTPCAAHCLDLLLEDLGKIGWIKDAIDSAKSITKFIYNHASVLSLMRRFTTNKELIRPAVTRFATSFISLQSLLRSKWELQSMFLSPEWRALSFSSKPEGEAICRLVTYQESFWEAVKEVCTISEPLVRVLRLVDGDKPAMGYLYEAMDRAKESIRAFYEDKGEQGQERQEMIWTMIDDRWNKTLHRPIHAAGLYLNPAFSYTYGFQFDFEVQSGFFECVERMVPSAEDRAKISKELELYKRSIRLFGFSMAINDRNSIMPNTWWENYGREAPILQRLAIRVLSQTCSSSGCERNWSVFEKIHTKKRNRLDVQRLNDMVYVYYNLRLWVKQIEKKSDANAISLDEIDTTAAWRAEAEEPVMEDAPDWLEEDGAEDHAISEELDEHVAALEGFQSHAESSNVPPNESDELMP